jgi:hypothetical protein
MSIWERIDADHPLTRAARENNAAAEVDGTEAVLDAIGILDDASVEQIYYLAEQRALRALAARYGEINPTGQVALTPEENALMPMLIGAYLDGIAIGWRGQQYASEEVAA